MKTKECEVVILLQMEDLHALGRVLLALATGNAFSARRDLVQQSMTYVTNHYSSDMKNLIRYQEY